MYVYVYITQATPSITGVRVREGRSSSVFAFVEGDKGSRDAGIVSFLEPVAFGPLRAFASFLIDFEFENASSSEFPTPTLRGLEVLSSDFGHPDLAIYTNIVIVGFYMATPIPYIWPW